MWYSAGSLIRDEIRWISEELSEDSKKQNTGAELLLPHPCLRTGLLKWQESGGFSSLGGWGMAVPSEVAPTGRGGGSRTLGVKLLVNFW